MVPFTHQTRWVQQINNKVFDNYVSWLMICSCLSLVNCPCLALPTSIAKNGAPIGIQIIAPPIRKKNYSILLKALKRKLIYLVITN